jgi:hypothetical protein
VNPPQDIGTQRADMCYDLYVPVGSGGQVTLIK